ncbi:hypothetical protein LEP1GSC188_2466 [Leptospira weilii serovar Topaz str. LT2116]|uniref:Uncharacterized protein n=1 Tax=Leptospira weilii serovar Topaz str. LT2116 TaxID=1088540 RepID=M3G2L0_9LEPT|nr:hypothetical protein LEP1GSC188_2466 [Leptospira weilii serovar Topaz str. LT2116]
MKRINIRVNSASRTLFETFVMARQYMSRCYLLSSLEYKDWAPS